MIVSVKQSDVWFCHCCTNKNAVGDVQCSICGRPESYVLDGYALPLHGKGVRNYRPSQVTNILNNIDESDRLHWSSLHSASYYGNVPVLIELIRLNAEVDAVSEQGHTPRKCLHSFT